ncbi:MAG TPA: prepilin-type N-terminal cleavage/methylation domain-containing protein [Gemmatimonadaceae bacterium]|nr:prepilin-type N-terminal cleavage/methylation domain-containing protein [Gemmatimonadaceae bacterium]
MRTRRRTGFTLLEVMVALVVGAVVILGARALLDGLSLHSERVRSLARSADAEANAEHVLRSVVLRGGLASDSAARFDGTPEQARFASWCDMAGGWQEQCEVKLVSEPHDDGISVVADLGEAGRLEVARHLDATTFRYLASASDGGHWVERWERAITPPLAIGLITKATPEARPDTMILRLGERD